MSSEAMTAAPAGAAVFCADIGGSFIKFGVSHRAGEVKEFGKVPTPTASWQEFVATFQRLMTQFGADFPAETPLALSTAGLVSPQTGELLATIYHGFGIAPDTIVYNHLNQPRELVKSHAVTSLFA